MVRRLTIPQVVIILLFAAYPAAAQHEDFSKVFRKKRVEVLYDLALRNDSLLIIGKVVESRKSNPIVGANIALLTHSIGTVSKTDGSFELYLPVSSGSLHFYHADGWQFSLPFEILAPIMTIDRSGMKRPNTRGF